MAKSSASNATKKATAKKTTARKASAPTIGKTAAMARKAPEMKQVDTIKEVAQAPTPKANAKPPVSTEQFVKEVKLEAQKVTWPTRKEVAITTGMVMWLVLIAAVFLLIVDFSLQSGMKYLLEKFTS